jgi:hypothetical protein
MTTASRGALAILAVVFCLAFILLAQPLLWVLGPGPNPDEE